MNIFRLKTTLIVLLVFFLFSNSFGQVAANEIRWSKDRTLEWSDFKKTADDNAPVDAWAWIGEFYGYTGNKDANGKYALTFETASAMRPDSSWVKINGKSKQILHHLQLRFDISEFFRRQLLAALKAFTYTDKYQEETQKIYQRITQQRTALLKVYEDQTENSKAAMFQKKWDDYIADLLNSNYTLEEALAKQPKKNE